MKPIFKLLLVLSVFAGISCEESTDPIVDDSDLLLGYWINPVVIDTLLRFERAVELQEDAYSCGFLTEHTFIERKNAGWCGTPPITLDDFDGIWTKRDSLIEIDVAYWGGIAHYQWKIISLDNSCLTVAVVKQEYGE